MRRNCLLLCSTAVKLSMHLVITNIISSIEIVVVSDTHLYLSIRSIIAHIALAW